MKRKVPKSDVIVPGHTADRGTFSRKISHTVDTVFR